MGQQQFKQLKQRFTDCQQQTPNSMQTQVQLLAKLQECAAQVTHKQLTSKQLQHHVLSYINLQIQNSNHNKKRRRSYQILQIEQQQIEETRDRPDSFSKECRILEEKMERIEEIQEIVRQNITDIMISQKPYKIRQNFRKLVLNFLKIDNLLLYVVHSEGRLQFHDFKANYITYVLENQKLKKIEDLIKQFQNETIITEVLTQFDLTQQAKSEQDKFKWGVNADDQKLKFCYVWKNSSDGQISQINKRIIKKVASIAMISSGEEEISIIQNYSKDLLDLLQLCIYQNENQICKSMGLGYSSLEEINQSLLNNKVKNQPLLARVCSYQQLEFQLLQRIRTYKKYVCQGDKIFMDFNESAQLTFLSNNFNHPLSSSFSKMVGHRKYYLQKIFQNYKQINDFLKKAVQKKIKNNKLYQLDFQTKARVKYSQEGRIIRLNVVIEQIQQSSSSGSNIYCNSSTKIISDGSQKQSFKDLPEQEQARQRRPSALIRNLQKENPGIINQGWINLFIKQHHMTGRKNTLMRGGKIGKSYAVKRSFSLNHQITMQTEQSKQKLPQINIQSIDLNLLQLQQEQLQPLVMKVFRKLQYFHTEHINKQYFENFLGDIHNGYQIHNNPFHNFTHGVNVMHTSYILSQPAKIRQLLTPFKLFTVVFSGLCHDVGHTGFTNLFQIASHSKKAITYNDNSPLENFHAAYTFQLLKKPQNNFLKDLTPQEMKNFRKSVINNILFTDIKEHFPLLKEFNTLIKDQIPKTEEYINILTSMIVHTADFGGSVKEFQICKAWSLKVNLQFSNQYRMEGELGLPQAPFMKDLTNITILSKNEGGFLKVIVFPLYEAMDQYCGTDLKIRRLRQYAENNIKNWQQIYQNSIKEEKKIDQNQKHQ